MKVTLVPVDVAQCRDCGGVLVPAGDDWRHQEDTGCAELGTPVICRYDDCGMPASVGGEACSGCAAPFRGCKV